MKLLVGISRILVGVLFIFSGFIKLNDPLGFSYKLQEYFSPGVLDIPNVLKQINQINNDTFISYILNERQDAETISSLQDFLQLNRLGTFGRLVLRKK